MDSFPSLPSLRRQAADDDDDLEEGEFIIPAGHQSSLNTDNNGKYYPLHPSYREDKYRDHPQHAHRLSLEGLLALGRGTDLPPPTPSCKSDGTLNDDANLSPTVVFKMTDLGCGMVLQGGWAATGKRGWAGGKSPEAAAPLNVQLSHSPSNVSGESSSTNSIIVHQMPAPPPPFAEQAQLLHQPVASSLLLPLSQLVLPERIDHPRRRYTCKECGMSFPTNQALGGHTATHRNMQREIKAVATTFGMGPEDGGALVAPLRRVCRKVTSHVCNKCQKVFPTGFALGGHMRVHYTGPRIGSSRKSKEKILALLPVENIAVPSSPGVSLALSIKTEDTSSPVPAGAAGRVVRLFGIDISAQAQQAQQ